MQNYRNTVWYSIYRTVQKYRIVFFLSVFFSSSKIYTAVSDPTPHKEETRNKCITYFMSNDNNLYFLLKFFKSLSQKHF